MKCFYLFSFPLFYFFRQIFISLLIFENITIIFGFSTDAEFRHAFDALGAILYPTLSPSIKITWIGKKMAEYRIVPDYVNLPPKEICNITYPDGLQIEPGIEVRAPEVKTEPIVRWDHKANQLHTLSMCNLDRSYRNETPWLVINIPGCDVAKGNVIRPYVSPRVPNGRNRHVFLVFEQKSPLNVTAVANYNFTRILFHMRSIAGEFNLGTPIAGNFFLVPQNYTNELGFFAY